MGLRDLNERTRIWWTDVRTGEKARILTLGNVLALGAAVVLIAIAVFSWPAGKDHPERVGSDTADVAPNAPPSQRSAVPSPPQEDKSRSEPAPVAPPAASPPTRSGTSHTGTESVEADISTRSVAITSSFSGTEIVIFGAVEESRQESAESGVYDIIVVVEGTHEPLIVRRKSNVAGLWINTEGLEFPSVPSYYAIASTRPIEEIADPRVLREEKIGLNYAPMVVKSNAQNLTDDQIAQFLEAVIRLKRNDGLFLRKPYGVAFIGRSLFRTTIDLPANVPVGPLRTKVYLFRAGDLLANYEAQVTLQRGGLEEFLHSFAFESPLLYGLSAVLIAVIAGLAASVFFRRRSVH